MICPQCQAENREAARFCRECGATFGAVCASCGARVEAASRFCDSCGAPLAATPAPETVPSRFTSPESYTPRHLAEKILTSKSALEGERKQVTVLFCDLANSTGLAERIGPDAMHSLLDRFFDLALGEVHRYEGTINQFLGDGFMALFGAPVAHEDHARRAALVALGIQRGVRERQAEIAGPAAGALAVRIGMNTGPVVVGKIGDNLRMDYTAVGDTTNLAARLQQLAEPSAIYASEATYRLIEPYVECEPLGERKLKGKAEAVAVYRLAGARARREPSQRDIRPIGSPLVGRDTELATLAGCLERVLAGHGAIVGVLGEAGLGKSRLVTEASRTVAGRGLLWLEGRALSFGQNLSYWPFLEILRLWAGITEEDSEAQSLHKLERHVSALFGTDRVDR
jgi:class 3 adenylate cyclase